MNPDVPGRIVDAVGTHTSTVDALGTFGLMLTVIVACTIILIFMLSIRSVGKSSKDGLELLVRALATASESSREVALEMRDLRGDLNDGLNRLTKEVEKLHECVDTLKEMGERRDLDRAGPLSTLVRPRPDAR